MWKSQMGIKWKVSFWPLVSATSLSSLECKSCRIFLSICPEIMCAYTSIYMWAHRYASIHPLLMEGDILHTLFYTSLFHLMLNPNHIDNILIFKWLLIVLLYVLHHILSSAPLRLFPNVCFVTNGVAVSTFIHAPSACLSCSCKRNS